MNDDSLHYMSIFWEPVFSRAIYLGWQRKPFEGQSLTSMRCMFEHCNISTCGFDTPIAYFIKVYLWGWWKTLLLACGRLNLALGEGVMLRNGRWLGIPVPGTEEATRTPQLLPGDILPPPFSCADCQRREERLDSPGTKWQVFLWSPWSSGGSSEGSQNETAWLVPDASGFTLWLVKSPHPPLSEDDNDMFDQKMTTKHWWGIEMRLVLESETTSSSLVRF